MVVPLQATNSKGNNTFLDEEDGSGLCLIADGSLWMTQYPEGGSGAGSHQGHVMSPASPGTACKRCVFSCMTSQCGRGGRTAAGEALLCPKPI